MIVGKRPIIRQTPCALAITSEAVRRMRDAQPASARGKARAADRRRARIFDRGWGTWIRTKTNRVRVCCATVTPFPTEALILQRFSRKFCKSGPGVFQIGRICRAHIAAAAFAV